MLGGEEGPARRIVLANAAAALVAAEKVASLPEGVARAAESIASGRAAGVLADLVANGSSEQKTADPPRQARQALEILDRAAQLVPLTQV